jgi:arginine repressor
MAKSRITTPAARKDAIAKLIAEEFIDSQEHLVAALKQQGF